MRKLIVLTFITLDGVMQAPGNPKEDTSGGFKYGGWSAPYGDAVSGKVMQKQMEPTDILLGRKTFEIFASFWPEQIRIVQHYECVGLEKVGVFDERGRYQSAQKFRRFRHQSVGQWRTGSATAEA
jgi:dihydrofolate reductase